MAILMLPSVPFLKPMGASKCPRPAYTMHLAFGGARALPIAPQAIKSPGCISEITSRNLLPAADPGD